MQALLVLATAGVFAQGGMFSSGDYQYPTAAPETYRSCQRIPRGCELIRNEQTCWDTDDCSFMMDRCINSTGPSGPSEPNPGSGTGTGDEFWTCYDMDDASCSNNPSCSWYADDTDMLMGGYCQDKQCPDYDRSLVRRGVVVRVRRCTLRLHRRHCARPVL